MTQVFLVPRNPLDLRPEKLEPLIDQIKELENGLTVSIRTVPQRGYGVTWWEVLEIVIIYVGAKGLDAAVGHPIQLLLDKITEKVRDWYQRRRAEEGNTRPLSLTFRDEEGRALRSVEMQESDDVEKGTKKKRTTKERARPTQPRTKQPRKPKT